MIKNRVYIIIAFILGMVGFLLLFKWFILNNIPPEDELAPGITIMLGVISGLLFAYIVHRIKKHNLQKDK